MEPLVSVIIPVYNVEKYLKECIDSVINQEYKNIEIIIINDGSTDNSIYILNDYQLKYRNIRIVTQENSGLSATRNKGIELATGKYIYFLDSDDYILPNTIKNLIEKMEENNLDIIRFSAEPFMDDGNNNLIDKNKYNFSKYFEKDKKYEKNNFIDLCVKGYSSSACLYIIKRNILIKNNLRFKTDILHEDELFTVELLLNINSGMYDPNAYYKRRYRSDSIMTTQSEESIKESFDSIYIIVNELNKLLYKYNNPSEINLIKNRMRALSIGLIYKDINEDYKKEQLSKLTTISPFDKILFTTWYKVKKIIKRFR